MAFGWVAILLSAGLCVVRGNPQAVTVSQRCKQDTNTFLWELDQDRPKEYAVLSECC